MVGRLTTNGPPRTAPPKPMDPVSTAIWTVLTWARDAVGKTPRTATRMSIQGKKNRCGIG